jgi:hypothetical protein
MAVWLYSASKARASESETLSLAYQSGFIWRSFYNRSGIPIACVKNIQPGDDLILGYRHSGAVKLLARFRVGRPDQPIAVSRAFGKIPAVWVDEFREQGYADDPTLGALIGIFVEEGEPLSGELLYDKQNSLSSLTPGAFALAASPIVSMPSTVGAARALPPPTTPRAQSAALAQRPPIASTTRDGIHIGIDVGGRSEKGFDLCITEWVGGLLKDVHWKRLPHGTPLPPTTSLRALVRDGNLAALAAATQPSASATAAALWRALEPFNAAGIHLDSPSAFSRNRLGHGRLCEKRSLTGVSFQSTPSIACGNEHGGDWGWLVYGMVAFAACLHRGQLPNAAWAATLENGTFVRSDSSGIILRECFPTATISVLRAQKREPDVQRSLNQQATRPEVQALLQYLAHGVKGVKRPRDPLYDRADALVAALGALPHVAPGFREVPSWATSSSRWNAAAGDEQIEGTFVCVE